MNEIELLFGSRIHNVFHTSCLKKALGQHIIPPPDLPPLDEEGKLTLVPMEILEERESQLRSKVIQEYLIYCGGLPIEDTTWEGETILQHPASQFLVGKHLREGRNVMYPL